MSQRARLGVIAAAVAVAVVGFVIASSSGDDTKKSASVPTKATTPGTTPSTGTGGASAEATPRIVVRNGKPVGGVKEITVSKGDPIRFTVVSDVADEIHVHGYDFHKDVAKGGTVSFSFPAKIDGVFVVELEKRGEQILSLKVEP
jgi:hypothetical protein